MSITFRRAEEQDLPAIFEIESLSFPQPHWSKADFLKFNTWVAVAEGRVSAFLVTREIFSGGSRSANEVEILNLAVSPEFRRRGLASDLLRNHLQPGVVYFLEVRESNAGARRLYTRTGFEEIGQRKRYYENPVETAIVMRMKE